MSKADRFRRLADNRDSEGPNPNKTDIINKIVGVDSDLKTEQKTTNTVHEETAVTVVRNSITEPEHVLVNNTNDAEQSDVTIKLNTVTEQSDVTINRKSPSRTRIPRAIEEFEKRLKKPTVEETHTRGTWLIRNDLLKRLEKLSKNQQRGFKTYLVNYALERVLDEFEGK